MLGLSLLSWGFLLLFVFFFFSRLHQEKKKQVLTVTPTKKIQKLELLCKPNFLHLKASVIDPIVYDHDQELNISNLLPKFPPGPWMK